MFGLWVYILIYLHMYLNTTGISCLKIRTGLNSLLLCFSCLVSFAICAICVCLLYYLSLGCWLSTLINTNWIYYYYYYYSNSLRHSSSSGSQNSTGVTDQAPLIHCSAKKFLTVLHVLSVSVFCIRIYIAGMRLGSFKFSHDLFGIISVCGPSAGGPVLSCRVFISSSFKSA